MSGLYPDTLYYIWLAARSQRGEGKVRFCMFLLMEMVWECREQKDGKFDLKMCFGKLFSI
jgi:hypothetical protein